MEKFKSGLDVVLGNLLKVTLLEQGGLEKMSSREVSSKFSYLLILTRQLNHSAVLTRDPWTITGLQTTGSQVIT